MNLLLDTCALLALAEARRWFGDSGPGFRFPAHPVDGGVVDHAQQVAALGGGIGQLEAAGGEFQEDILKQVADGGFIPQQRHAVAEHGADVLVVDTFQFRC